MTRAHWRTSLNQHAHKSHLYLHHWPFDALKTPLCGHGLPSKTKHEVLHADRCAYCSKLQHKWAKAAE